LNVNCIDLKHILKGFSDIDTNMFCKRSPMWGYFGVCWL